MKKNIINIMASTGIILLVLSIVAVMYGGRAICINTICEVAMLSIFIHSGLSMIHRFDIQNAFLERAADISYIVVITLVSGTVFGWYQSISVWVIVIMVFIIYVVGYLTDLYRTKEEVRMINELLQDRKKSINQ